jgi:hypothetical protein
MTRLTLSLAIWLGLVSVVSASPSPRKEAPSSHERTATVDLLRQSASRLTAKRTPVPPAAVGVDHEFLMTDSTAVLLDGKACRYEEVPAQARILRMEIAPDRKTVIRVFFGTRK